MVPVLREVNEFKKASCWWNGWVLGQNLNTKLPSVKPPKASKVPYLYVKSLKHKSWAPSTEAACALLAFKERKNIRTAGGVMKKQFLGWESEEKPKYITGYQ